jgi:amino acid adenylation domain-containing protein
MSYAELDVAANRVAHALRALGLGAEHRVALCTEKNAALVVGLLGIMKAGAAFVPLDPSYPPERLAWVLGDCAPGAVLTQTSLLDSFDGLAVPRLALDDEAALAAYPATSLGNEPAPQQLAYVIYTSGSTGRPKGVQIEHRGLRNLVDAQIELFGLHPDSRVLQFASIGFDACVSEIGTALGSGATLLLAPREALWPGDALRETIVTNRITHITLPPSAVAALNDPSALPPLTLVMAGEACPPALAQAWSRRHTVINAYGPTECTVCASSHRCTGGEAHGVPIGRPIANTRVYILDAAGRPVPLGVAGELHIAGIGVARGYLGRADLTAERFSDDPFVAGERMYRTGDVGRWLADGSICFLGRNDEQVKLRGFRIELGEIESQLGAADGVRDAAVMVREDVEGDRRIVGYVTPVAGVELRADALREQVARRLPDYMVPAALVILPELPLTPHGKVDRRALPAPDLRAAMAQAYEAPTGQVEMAMAAIWSEILGSAAIGRHDHFFELGGHSLSAARLLGRIRDTWGVAIPLTDLFQAPTIAALATQVMAAELARYSDEDVAQAMAGLDALSETEIAQLLEQELKLQRS